MLLSLPLCKVFWLIELFVRNDEQSLRNDHHASCQLSVDCCQLNVAPLQLLAKQLLLLGALVVLLVVLLVVTTASFATAAMLRWHINSHVRPAGRQTHRLRDRLAGSLLIYAANSNSNWNSNWNSNSVGRPENTTPSCIPSLDLLPWLMAAFFRPCCCCCCSRPAAKQLNTSTRQL